MCRFAGYIGRPRSPADLLYSGDHSLEVQSYRPRELLHGHVNVDGFGVSWYPGDLPVRITDPRPPWHDPDLPALLRSFQASPILASVRNTTPGIPVDRSGLSPLVHGRWTFVLNGFIKSFRTGAMRELHALLPDDLYAELSGVSDTEALFLLLVNYARQEASLEDAIRRLTTEVLRVCRDRELDLQLNLLTSDGVSLVATRMGSAPLQNSLYLKGEPWDGTKARDVEKLQGAKGPGVWLASEPLDDPGAWVPVPESSLVVATLDGSVHLASLDPRSD